MAEVNYIQASPILASYPEYKNTYIYLTFKVNNKVEWNKNLPKNKLVNIGRNHGNVPVQNSLIWDDTKKWCKHDNTKAPYMETNSIDGQLFGNANGITLTERLWDSTISDKYFSSDPNSPLLSRCYIFHPSSIQYNDDEETYVIMRYETDGNGNVITLEPDGVTPEMIRLTFDIQTGAEMPTYYLENVRIHAKSKNTSCNSVIYEDVLIDGSNDIKYIDKDVFTITSSIIGGNWGSITPLGEVSVAKGGSQSYSITADSGYEVYQVIIDGVGFTGLQNYTFTGVQANHVIQVQFRQANTSHRVSITYAPVSGLVIPNGIEPCPGLGNKADLPKVTTVDYNGSIAITPNVISQYAVDSVTTIPTTSMTESSGTYTFTNIIENTNIVFNIKEVEPSVVRWVVPNGDGKINDDYSGTSSPILPGGQYELKYVATSPKVLDQLYINNSLVNTTYGKSSGSYTITNILEDKNVYAYFAFKPDPPAFTDWKLKFVVTTPNNDYTFKFTMLNYSAYTSHAIDCNYDGVGNAVIDNYNQNRKIVEPSSVRDNQDPSEFDLCFPRQGTYTIAFNFSPNNFHIAGVYSQIISKIYYNAGVVNDNNKPILTFNGCSNLTDFHYLYVSTNAPVFNDNLKLVNSSNNVICWGDDDLRQIGNDSNSYSWSSAFSGMSIREWNGFSFVEILKGQVFNGSKLPMLSDGTFSEFTRLNRIEGPVFKNVSGIVRNSSPVTPIQLKKFKATKPYSNPWRNATDLVSGWYNF